MIREKYECNAEAPDVTVKKRNSMDTPTFKNLKSKVKRRMFSNMRQETAFLTDLREHDMLWQADAENGFLSFSKMKYVTN